jgi:hypothetical protein
MKVAPNQINVRVEFRHKLQTTRIGSKAQGDEKRTHDLMERVGLQMAKSFSSVHNDSELSRTFDTDSNLPLSIRLLRTFVKSDALDAVSERHAQIQDIVQDYVQQSVSEKHCEPMITFGHHA